MQRLQRLTLHPATIGAMNGLITTGAAARALGISTATLTRWAAAGKVTPAERTLGGHYRWNLAALRAEVHGQQLRPGQVAAEEIARVVHAAQRELQIILGDPWPAPPWDEAPDYQVRQATDSVAALLADPGRTPEQNHQGWAQRMRAAGWRYGPVKDTRARTHPCLVPFADLPEPEQRKNYLFIAITRALAAGRPESLFHGHHS